MIARVYCAGVPETGARAQREHGDLFCGDETPVEPLTQLGVPNSRTPGEMDKDAACGDTRTKSSQDLLRSGKLFTIRRVDRSACEVVLAD